MKYTEDNIIGIEFNYGKEKTIYKTKSDPNNITLVIVYWGINHSTVYTRENLKYKFNNMSHIWKPITQITTQYEIY